jgi:hypothetical protein
LTIEPTTEKNMRSCAELGHKAWFWISGLIVD